MYELESTSPRTPSRWRAQQGKVKALAGRDGLGFCPTFNQSAYLLFFPCVVALCAILPDSVSEPQVKNMRLLTGTLCAAAQPSRRRVSGRWRPNFGSACEARAARASQTRTSGRISWPRRRRLPRIAALAAPGCTGGPGKAEWLMQWSCGAGMALATRLEPRACHGIRQRRVHQQEPSAPQPRPPRVEKCA